MEDFKPLFNNTDKFNIWVNAFATGYYYYYLEDSNKIPILNYLLYLDKKELLWAFLKLIEFAEKRVKLCFLEDDFGYTPFQIA